MTEDIFNAAYSIWNSLIEIAMTLFTTSPRMVMCIAHVNQYLIQYQTLRFL